MKAARWIRLNEVVQSVRGELRLGENSSPDRPLHVLYSRRPHRAIWLLHRWRHRAWLASCREDGQRSESGEA